MDADRRTGLDPAAAVRAPVTLADKAAEHRHDEAEEEDDVGKRASFYADQGEHEGKHEAEEDRAEPEPH